MSLQLIVHVLGKDTLFQICGIIAMNCIEIPSIGVITVLLGLIIQEKWPIHFVWTNDG